MLKKFFFGMVAILMIFSISGTGNAVIIDFLGGTAYLSDGTSVTTTESGLWTDSVDYYIEDGIKIDFIGGYGTIGDYYSIGNEGTTYNNPVIHAHWHNLESIVFSKVDGTTMDLNYMDLTSNTEIGGGQATGNEVSHVSAGGYSMLLPSSDWGLDYDYYGEKGDGIERLWLDDNFDDISSFIVTSQNAYCFGLDNFYIDEPAPPAVPEPNTLALMGLGLFGLLGLRSRMRRHN